MTSLNFFDLPRELFLEHVTSKLSFLELCRLFVSGNRISTQIDTLITLLQKGKTKKEINILTHFLTYVIQQRQKDSIWNEQFERLAPAIKISLQCQNTTMAHQLAGNFLLSGKQNLDKSEAWVENFQTMLETMSIDDEMINVFKVLLIAGNEQARIEILTKLILLEVNSAYSEVLEKLNSILIYFLENTPCHDAPIFSKLWSFSTTKTRDNSDENVNKLLHQLSVNKENTLLFQSVVKELSEIFDVLLKKDNHQKIFDTFILLSQDTKRIVRCQAVYALQSIWPAFSHHQREEAMNIFLERLDDEYETVRQLAMIGINNFFSRSFALSNPQYEEVINSLLKKSADDDLSVARMATDTLIRILNFNFSLFANQREKTVNTFLNLLNDKSTHENIRSEAARNLGKILGSSSLSNNVREKAVTALLESLQEGGGAIKVRQAAVFALSNMVIMSTALSDSWCEIATHVLLVRLDDNNLSLRASVRFALGEIVSAAISLPDSKSETVVNALLEQMHVANDDSYIRFKAISALGEILSGPVLLSNDIRTRVINILAARLYDISECVCKAAASALGGIVIAAVFLSADKRKEIIMILINNFNRLNNMGSDIKKVLIKILDAILDSIKNPHSANKIFHTLNANTKEIIVNWLLQTNDKIGEQYLMKFIYWDQEFRSIIQETHTENSPPKIKKIYAFMKLIEYCGPSLAPSFSGYVEISNRV